MLMLPTEQAVAPLSIPSYIFTIFITSKAHFSCHSLLLVFDSLQPVMVKVCRLPSLFSQGFNINKDMTKMQHCKLWLVVTNYHCQVIIPPCAGCAKLQRSYTICNVAPPSSRSPARITSSYLHMLISLT